MTSQALGATGQVQGNRIGNSRIWLGGGAVGLVTLLALGWFLVIQPQIQVTNQLRDRAATAQDAITQLQQKLATARLESRDLDGYRARLAKARAALPSTAAISTFLDDVQSAAVRTGVVLRGMIVGTPARVTGLSGQLYALPISLSAAGTAARLEAFLTALQRVQPRAVLVSTANLTPDAASVSLAGAATLLIGLRAYVDPAARTVPSPGPVASAGSTSSAQSPAVVQSPASSGR